MRHIICSAAFSGEVAATEKWWVRGGNNALLWLGSNPRNIYQGWLVMAMIHEQKAHLLSQLTWSCNSTDILKEKACPGMKLKERRQHVVHLTGTVQFAKPVFTLS